MKLIHTSTIGAFACISALIGVFGCGDETVSTSTGATTTATTTAAAGGAGNGSSSSNASNTTAATGGSSTTGGGMGGMTASTSTDAGASTASGMGMMAAPDFSIKDVNPSSASLGNDISPKDYQGQATAWFFGHST